jgi:ABC-type bacteriocin/lantibiotic exporter with double-glycine peptidase domain
LIHSKFFFRFFKQYLADSNQVIFYAVLFSLFQALLLLPSVYFIKNIFDTNIPQHDVRGVIINSVLVLGLTLLQSLATIIHRNYFLKKVKSAIKQVQQDVLRGLIRAERKFYDTTDRAGIINRSVGDVDLADKMLDNVLSVMIPQLTLFCIGVLIMLVYNPIIGLVTLLLGLFGVIIQRRIRRKVLESIRRYNTAKDELTSYVNFLPAKQVLTKMRHAEELESVYAAVHSDNLIRDGMEAARRGWAVKVTDELILNISATLLIVLGAIQILLGLASYGNILGLYFIIMFLKRTVTSVQSNWSTFQEGIISLEGIFDLLQNVRVTEIKTETQIVLADFKGNIQAQKVSFRYAEDLILEDVDFNIRAGEIINITGPNGAGKSSLIHLILGFYKPCSGVIRADDHPYETLNLGELRTRIGYVPQNQVLIRGTIESNLTYGLTPKDLLSLKQMESTRLYNQLIGGFKNGIKSYVSEGGKNLSNGQIQRISILRALASSPKLLILDEPTNHLDGPSIVLLVKEIRDKMRMSVLIISHHAIFREIADRSYVLDQANLIPVEPSLSKK